jgi:DNA-binding NarL/FixJ family response regulator
VTRVLIADDQPLMRTGFRMILDAEPDIEVVGEAADGEEAIRLTARVRADVVLMDVRMPRMDGIEATRRLAGPGVEDPVRVLILTTFDLDEYVLSALRAGRLRPNARAMAPRGERSARPLGQEPSEVSEGRRRRLAAS